MGEERSLATDAYLIYERRCSRIPARDAGGESKGAPDMARDFRLFDRVQSYHYPNPGILTGQTWSQILALCRRFGIV